MQGLSLTMLILGGSINSQLGKDPCKDIARFTSDNVDPGVGVNQQSTWKGFTKILQELSLTMLILDGVVV